MSEAPRVVVQATGETPELRVEGGELVFGTPSGAAAVAPPPLSDPPGRVELAPRTNAAPALVAVNGVLHFEGGR